MALKSKAMIMIAIWFVCLLLINGIKVQLLKFDTFNLNYAHAQQQTFTAKLSGQKRESTRKNTSNRNG